MSIVWYIVKGSCRLLFVVCERERERERELSRLGLGSMGGMRSGGRENELCPRGKVSLALLKCKERYA